MQRTLFDEISRDTRGHFKLYYYAALLVVLRKVSASLGSYERALEVFPFLGGYTQQFRFFAHQNGNLPTDDDWQVLLTEWEAGIREHLPLRALRDVARFEYHDLLLWMLIGLPEADGRFGILFETLQGTQGQTRLTLGLLLTWFDESIYGSIRRFANLGLVRIHNQGQVRPEWVLQMTPTLWDVILDMPAILEKPQMRYRSHDDLPPLDELVLSDNLRTRLLALKPLLIGGHVDAVIIRGLQHNGRRDVLSGLAHALGRGVLLIEAPPPANDGYWHDVGALATALDAMPILVYDMGPGEIQHIPHLSCYEGAIGVVIGQTGGITGAGVERAVILPMPLPDVGERAKLWQRALQSYDLEHIDSIARQLRVTRGHIEHIAHIAESYARLEERHTVTETDVRQASQAINHHALDLLAVRIQPLGSWDDLIVEASTLAELQILEKRCRHRENLIGALDGALSGSLNAGVRALLQGPSGTGKTMATHILAAELNKDLYRVDLASVVNKYIGETEKNLNQVLSRAEELDVILLLDEGDALLTRRTTVQTSNDRYANLETNYLLQRLEAYEGILLITTNAADHIDDAFERRMDVVVTFKTPTAADRLAIWIVHLPASHQVDEALLREIARRCTLSGGQIRNAVLHATLLALDAYDMLQSEHIRRGVLREYEKSGEICPLPFN